MDEEVMDVELEYAHDEEISEGADEAGAPEIAESGDTPPAVPDYEAIAAEDLAALREAFPDMRDSSLSDLRDPVRYGELRELGLTPTEAYLASGARRARIDGRTHLTGAIPRRRPSGESVEIPREELMTIRSVFSDMPEKEMRALYRRVRS